MNAVLVPTAWTTGTTEVFKTGTWRSSLPVHLARPSPCHQACPVHGDIAEWIGHARAGDLRAAWQVLVRHNPFPAIAGRICHHPCESACNRAAYDEALSICKLERAAGDAALQGGWAFDPPAVERDRHVAVVGGGPSGLSAAYHLRRCGWRVTLYESRPQLGGLMRYGIPAYRLSREVLDAEVARIIALGVEVKTEAPLTALGLETLQATCDAVYLATGAARPKRLPQLPESAPWLMQGAEYLARCSEGGVPRLGRRVAVIGGGSAAMDVARSARRHGCEVTLLAVEPAGRLPAQREELAEAAEEGVTVWAGSMLESVEAAAAGGGLALHCVRVDFQPGAQRGSFSVAPVPDTAFTFRADAVLVAIGQDPDLSPYAALPNVGPLLAADENQATADPKVWAGGDLASMGRYVTEAVAMGKRAAQDIDRALRGDPRSTPSAQAEATTLPEIATWYHPHARRAPAALRPVAARLANDEEVQLALTPEQVRAEAQRCFSCGACTHCDNCFQFCPDLAVTHVDGGYQVLADYCKGCGLCVRECPTGSMVLQEERR